MGRGLVGWVLALVCGCYLSHEVERADGAPDAGPAVRADAGEPVVEDPEAQWFVYRRRRVTVGGDYEFYAIRLGDLRVLPLGTSASEARFAWSPTQAGRYARVLSEGGGPSSVQVAQLQPSRFDEVDSFRGRFDPGGLGGWSADGRYLHYRAPEQWAVHDTREHRRFLVADQGVWIADQPWLFIERFSGGPVPMVATAESGFEAMDMPALDPGRLGMPAWAPGSGGFWAELHPRPDRFELWVGTGPFATPQRLREYEALGLRAEWSRSGDHLLAGDTVWRREGDTVVPVVEAPAGEPIRRDAIGGDEAWLVRDRLVLARGDEVVLTRLREDAFEETLLLISPEPCTASWTEGEPVHVHLVCGSDERHHVWTEARGTVHVAALDGFGRGRRGPEVFWSPSGERAMVLRDRVLFELASLDAELRPVAEPVSWVEWSQDSSAYVYSTNPGGLTVVMAETGEVTEILPADDEYLVASEGFQRVD